MDWCILRTASRSTIGLAESLAKDGFDVWTPIETRTMRVPRMNVRRPVRMPIMPSYVFAQAHHLVDLLQLAQMPVKPRRGPGLREPAHAGFSVLHWRDRIPLVADVALTELRKIEAKRTPIQRAAYSFPQDSSVKVKEGAFGGLLGTVVRSTPKSTVLRFGESFEVEIPTSLLHRDEIQAFQSAVLEAA